MKKMISYSAFLGALFFSLMLFSSSRAVAQDIVSGKVLNASNEPLKGATVKIKGTKLATQTNEQGAFRFEKVPVGSTMIEVSIIGYRTAEISFTSGTDAIITLTELVLQGDEVIVTGVFDRRKKMEASVAITTMNTAQISKLAPPSAADLLRNVPGVFVNSALGEVRNTVYSRGVSIGSNDGASGYYYVSMQEDGLPVTNVTYGNYGPDYFLRADATLGKLEAVRGGTATIVGSNSPGGIFNYISKEGGSKFGGEFRTKYGLEGDGRFPYYRADINVGGPLANVKGLTYNIGGFYRHAQGARDPGYTLNKGFQFKGNIVKKFKSGSLKLYGKYLNDRNGSFEFTPTVGFDNPKPAPGFSRYSSVLIAPVTQTVAINGNPNEIETFDTKNLIHSLDRSIGLNWEQRLGNGWSFNNLVRYSDKIANWNTTGLVAPLAFDDYISYSFLGAISANAAPKFGTYTFKDAITGNEYGKTMLLPKLDANGNFIGFDVPVLNSNFPGNAVSPNSFFFNPLLHNFNHVKELIEQFSITKKLRNMSFTAGAYYGRSKINNKSGIAGLGFGTIENKPQLVNVTYTDFAGQNYQVTNSQGVAGIGGTGYNVKEGVQKQFAFFGGHSWQISDKLNIDWGVRYERLAFEGFNNQSYADPRGADPAYGGMDGLTQTLYDNGGGVIRKDTLLFEYDRSLSTFSYSGGLNYKFTNQFAVYGRYSSGKKAPDMGFVQSIDAPGDELLEMEAQHIQQFEAGIKFNKKSFTLFVTPFYSLLSNVPEQQVASNPDNSVYSTPLFYNKYATYGIELEGNYNFAKYFTIHSVATIQGSKAKDFSVWILNAPGPADDVKLDNSGGETDNNANLIMNNTLSFNKGKFNSGLTWSYMGARQANVNNAFELTAFSQFHLSASYDVSKHFQLSFNINNLTNVYGVMSWGRPGTFLTALDRQGFTKEMLKANPNAVYSTVAVPPRAFFATATFKF